MNWTELIVKSVKDAFSSVEPLIGTGKEGRELGVNPKGDTSYHIDKVAEEAYLKNLPDHITIVSEESEIRTGSEFIIALDPVCGSNFAKRGSRHFTTGISVFSHDLEPICEAIGIFDTKDIYYADKNGAFKNGKPIHVTDKKTIEDSVINFESHSIGERIAFSKTELMKKAPVMFCPGSDKLSLAMLSEGVIDGYVCASEDYPFVELIGILLVQKAGGIVTDVRGNKIRFYPDFEHKSSLLCAATKELHAEMLALL